MLIGEQKVNMPAGRPRTVSLPPDQMIELGEEMIAWVKENDPLHLSEFYCIHKGYTDKEWDTMHVAEEFFPYYEQALKIIGRKYLDKNSNIRDGISHRWLGIYFKDLRRKEMEDVTHKAEAPEIAKKKYGTQETYSEEALEHNKALMDQLKEMRELQKQNQDLINELNKYKIESKS